MPINSKSVNSKLFDFFASKGYHPKPLDVEGKVTPVPEEAAVIKFDFIKDGKNYGKVWVSVDGTKTLQVYYGDKVSSSPGDITKGSEYDDTWMGLIKHLKKWAQRRQLGFDLRNENHLAADMARRKYSESITESVSTGVKLTFTTLELHENQINSYAKKYFESHNIQKSHQKFISNVKRLGTSKLIESEEAEEIHDFIQALTKVDSKKKIKIGDTFAVLAFEIIFAWREIEVFGFTEPKQVADIKLHSDGTINYIKFTDGDRYPRLVKATHNNKPIIQAVYFDNKNSAEKALTYLKMITPDNWDIDFSRIDKDNNKFNDSAISENKIKEIGYADALDDSNYSTDKLLKVGKVIGQIENYDVMSASSGTEKVYFLVVDGEIAAFLGFKNGNLKNIKNFTNAPGVVRALIGYLVHKANKKIKISADEQLTPDGIKWLIHLIKSPRGLTIVDQTGNPVDTAVLKKEWVDAKKTGTPGKTSITISENSQFGNKLRENEERRKKSSLLMPFNLYNIPTKEDMVEGKDTMKQTINKKSSKQGVAEGKGSMKQVNEGYYPLGKQGSYSDAVPTTKIILQHTRKIEEGEQRYRNIAKIFVENMSGEKFLIPTTKPGIARVYARHIAEGGTPYDERGKHITSLVEEYQKMAGFVRATKNKQFNESAQQLVNEGVNHYQSLRETLHKMCGHRGYNTYFENYTPTLIEDGEEQNNLNELFVQETLDPRIESVMPILSRLHKKVSEMRETGELAEWVDNVIESSLEISSPLDKTISENIIRTNKKINNIIENKFPKLPDPKIFFDRDSHINEWNQFKQDMIQYQMKYNDGTENCKLRMRKIPKFISEAYHMESEQGLGEIKSLLETAFKNSIQPEDLEIGKKYDVAVVFLDKLSKILEVNLHHDQTIKNVDYSDSLNDYVVSTEEGLEGTSAMDQVEDVETLFFEKGGKLDSIQTFLKMKVEPELEGWKVSVISDRKNREEKLDENSSVPIDVRNLYAQIYAKYAKIVGAAKGAKQMAYAQVEKKYGKEMADKLKAYHNSNENLGEEIDADQKRAGQMGPTEKVGPKGAVGKLVGTSESVEQGVAESYEKKDMTGQTCEKCKKDTYQERSLNDDWNGTLRCSCGHVVDRWRKYRKKEVKEGQEDLESILKIVRK